MVQGLRLTLPIQNLQVQSLVGDLRSHLPSGKKKKKKKSKHKTEAILQLVGQPGPGFQFPVKWWDSLPPSGNLEPANQYAPSKKQRES